MTNPTVITINEAVDALVADFEIPEPFVTREQGNGSFAPYTCVRISLPNDDGDDLVIAEDDNVAVVTRRAASTGVVLDEIKVVNPRLPILLAVLGAFVHEALTDPTDADH